MTDQKYYVVSSGDAPERIFFSLEDAKDFGSEYIDVFNAEGEWVSGWRAVYETDKNGRALVDENVERIIIGWE